MSEESDVRRDDALEAVARSLGLRLESSQQIRREATAEGFATGHRVVLVDDDDARREETVFVESAPPSGERDGVLRVAGDPGDLAAWVYPADPGLPALAGIVTPDSAARLVERFGVRAEGLTVEVAAYRPGKRAVIRLGLPDRVLFAKVVKPDDAGPMVARHEAWLAAGLPVPEVVGWSEDGLVVLTRLPGVEASSRIAQLDRAAIQALPRRVGSVRSATPARASLTSRVGWYAERLSDLDSRLAPAAERVCSDISALLAATPAAPLLQTVHGDLHLGQVFVDPADPGRITGILDIDTAGLGDPADDLAALWAHLVVTRELMLAQGHADAASAAALADELADGWGDDGDAGRRDRVRAVAATHLLGHALSGTVGAERAIELARRTLAEERPSIAD